MKIIMLCLALATLSSELPGVAQTSPAFDAAASKNVSAPPIVPMNLNGVHTGGGSFPFTPQQKALQDAKMDKINDLTQAGTEALHLKNFAEAEADYRELLQMEPVFYNYYGLGEALAGQGETTEALAAYKTAVDWPLNTPAAYLSLRQAGDTRPNLRGCSFPTDAVAWMKYALLLSQTGQNAEAFSVYTQASRIAIDTNHPDLKLSFSAGQPSPTELQAAAHIALGLLVNDTGNDRELAMSEFAQARSLAPDAAVTNFYYGYGWQRLDLNSPTRAANAGQAKAALAKAAASADDHVKKAASEALKRMP